MVRHGRGRLLSRLLPDDWSEWLELKIHSNREDARRSLCLILALLASWRFIMFRV
jgi:hypothetical protein